MSERVVVVGGGIVGLTAAYYLRAQDFEVVVIERRKIGTGASLGNAGWIVPSLSAPLPQPGLPAYALGALRRRSPLFIAPRLSPTFVVWLLQFLSHCNVQASRGGFHAIAALSASTMTLFDELRDDGVLFSMWKRGLLFAFMDESAAQRELQQLRALGDYGYRLPDALQGDALRQLEPSLSRKVHAGFLIEQERHVDPGSVTKGLAASLRQRGVRIVEGAEVTGFDRNGDRVTAVWTATEAIQADHVVLAAGAWSGRLARKLSIRIPLEAGKGYSFSYQPQRPPKHPLYLSDVKIGVSPLLGGLVRVAGTMELSGLNLRLDTRRIAAMSAQAGRFLSEPPNQAISDQWVGMRPMAPDGLPIIGRAAGYDNVFLSTGHNTLGVTLAPATAVNLAELVATGRTPPVLEPFSPKRFRRARRARQDVHPSHEEHIPEASL